MSLTVANVSTPDSIQKRVHLTPVDGKTIDDLAEKSSTLMRMQPIIATSKRQTL